MINTEKTRRAVNKALDFKRDEEVGYMLTDLDIINGIPMADFNEEVSFEEAKQFFIKICLERKEVN